jgi:hypothetical protein
MYHLSIALVVSIAYNSKVDNLIVLQTFDVAIYFSCVSRTTITKGVPVC